MDTLYLVMPAYNEEANIENVVSQWHLVVQKINDSDTQKKSRLVIANDGSKDHTYEILKKLKKEYPYLEPIDKPNLGHGSTLLFLYKKAIDENVDYVFQTDSDGQTIPDEFWQFWNDRKQYDFMIGYRKGRKDGASRVFVAKTLKLIVWLLFGEKVADANTPFRLMKVENLIPILKLIPQDFFLCNVVISTIVVKWKEKYKYYPVTFRPRQGGVNTINIKRIIKIGWKALGDFRMINKDLKKHEKTR